MSRSGMRIDGPLGRLVSRVAGSRAFARIAPPIVTPLDKFVHRLTGGRVMLSQGVVQTLVLTTTGAKSGEPRTVPLACLPDGDRFYVVGSNFGRAAHPGWTANLLRHPEARASFRGREFPVRAHLLDEAEKDQIWPRLTAVWPNYDLYRDRSGRNLRVFCLEPA